MNKKDILIIKISKSGERIIITDQEGDLYSFFQKKQDGKITKAYQDFVNKGIKEGDLYSITFKTNGKYKNILWFDEIKKTEVEPFKTPNEIKQVKKNQDDKWNEIARGKVRHAFALEAYKAGKPLNQSTIQVIDSWVDYVMSGKLSAEEDTAMGTAPQQVDTGEVPVSDIPF